MSEPGSECDRWRLCLEDISKVKNMESNYKYI